MWEERGWERYWKRETLGGDEGDRAVNRGGGGGGQTDRESK